MPRFHVLVFFVPSDSDAGVAPFAWAESFETRTGAERAQSFLRRYVGDRNAAIIEDEDPD